MNIDALIQEEASDNTVHDKAYAAALQTAYDSFKGLELPKLLLAQASASQGRGTEGRSGMKGWDDIWNTKIAPGEEGQSEIVCTKPQSPYVLDSPDPTCVHAGACGMDYCMLGLECAEYKEAQS